MEASADQLLEVCEQGRHGISQGGQFGAIHHHSRNRAGSDNGRGSLVRLEDADLPHDVSRPELRDEVIPIEDVGRPALDHKQLVGKTTLLDECGVIRDIHFVRMLGNGLTLPSRQAGEQREIFELGWIHVLLSALNGQGYREVIPVASPSVFPDQRADHQGFADPLDLDRPLVFQFEPGRPVNRFHRDEHFISLSRRHHSGCDVNLLTDQTLV